MEIDKFFINKNFLKGANGNDYSPTEKFVLDVLCRENQLASNRHGLTELKECDIIDEISGKQIEVVTAFKVPVEDITRSKNDVFYLAELINTNVIQVSKALKDKLYEKEYTDKYKKELAIFCFGTKQSTRTLIDRLKEMIQKDKVLKNDFTKVHFIIYDFLFDKVYYICGRIKNEYSTDELIINFIKKDKISYYDIEKDKEYIIITKNIFNNETGISMLSGKDIHKFIDDFKISI